MVDEIVVMLDAGSSNMFVQCQLRDEANQISTRLLATDHQSTIALSIHTKFLLSPIRYSELFPLARRN